MEHEFLSDFTKEELQDLVNFDGNVQGLRLLLRLGEAHDEFSFNLTFPTLATVIKYPRDSVSGNDSASGNIASKKFGYFQAEEERYGHLNSALDLSNHRHPLCWLMESADDICYSVSDIEDGFKKGTISLRFLIETLGEGEFARDELCQKLKKTVEEGFRNSTPHALIIQDCRVIAQKNMTNAAVGSFVRNHDAILDGTYQHELLKDTDCHLLRKFFEEIAHENFRHDSVLQNEILGENILSFLLERLWVAVISSNFNDTRTIEGKMYRLISGHARRAFEREKNNYRNEKYLKMLMITDFVSGMTDSYAQAFSNSLRG